MDTREKYITKDIREIKEQVTLEIIQKEDEIRLAEHSIYKEKQAWHYLLDMLLDIRIDIENIKAGNKWNGHSWQDTLNERFE